MNSLNKFEKILETVINLSTICLKEIIPPVITFPKSTTDTLEYGVNYVQS